MSARLLFLAACMFAVLLAALPAQAEQGDWRHGHHWHHRHAWHARWHHGHGHQHWHHHAWQ